MDQECFQSYIRYSRKIVSVASFNPAVIPRLPRWKCCRCKGPEESSAGCCWDGGVWDGQARLIQGVLAEMKGEDEGADGTRHTGLGSKAQLDPEGISGVMVVSQTCRNKIRRVGLGFFPEKRRRFHLFSQSTD